MPDDPNSYLVVSILFKGPEGGALPHTVVRVPDTIPTPVLIMPAISVTALRWFCLTCMCRVNMRVVVCFLWHWSGLITPDVWRMVRTTRKPGLTRWYAATEAVWVSSCRDML